MSGLTAAGCQIRLAAGAPGLFSAVLLLTAAAAPSPARALTLRVTFRTDDNVAIAATYYEPARRPAPAVVLVHMITRARSDWEPVASRLADSGIAALAIDLRGHGESDAPPSDGPAAEPAAMTNDVKAARRFLQGRSDVMNDRVGLAGASVGASLVALAAASDETIRSLALLSPGLDYRGLRIDAAMRKYADRPVLLVASAEDPYASRSARELAAGGTRRELRMLNGAGHGTVMLARDPDLARALVDWFLRTLL